MFKLLSHRRALLSTLSFLLNWEDSRIVSLFYNHNNLFVVVQHQVPLLLPPPLLPPQIQPPLQLLSQLGLLLPVCLPLLPLKQLQIDSFHVVGVNWKRYQ